jgi:cyanophycin synthetase
VKIYSIQSLTGRNIYSHRPVIKMIIDIGDLHTVTSKDVAGFNEKFICMFPGIKKHHCSSGYEGGFVDRLIEGTYAGHVIEHLALELQCINGYDVFFGKTRILKEPSMYNIVFEFMNEKCGIESGRAAINIIHKMFRNEVLDIENILDNLRKVSIKFELGPSTKSIFCEAKRRGIPVSKIGDDSLIQMGYGKYARLFSASLSDGPSCISVDIAGNKHLTKQILENNGISVPRGELAYSEEEAVEIAKIIGYPVVVKPCDVNQGKGVSLNIFNELQVRHAYKTALKFSRLIVIEKQIEGIDYRVLVVGDKVSAVAERKPPCITGDGVHSLKELVEYENKNPLRGECHEKPLTKIKFDSVVQQTLLQKGIDENYIPHKGESIVLRGNGNLSTGGKARECTDEIHPINKQIAVKAAKVIGLDIAGIDIKTHDISIPIDNNNGAVLEVNAAPGLRMHIYPSEGNPKNVAKDIINMIFPEGKPSSIPIVSITGTNGKTTTTRLISHVLSSTGIKIGMTSSSGIFIGNECILKGDNTGPISAGIVLSHREVEAAVLETARGGIVRKGLGYDMADVGVIVNIDEDHIGLDNLNSIEDLAFAKSLVVEAVKPDGYAVINADNKMSNYVMRRVKSKLILFSKNRDNSLLAKHAKSGGITVYIKDGIICISNNKRIVPIIDCNKIPITMGGIVEFNVENSLAAVSSLYALKVPIEIIKKGLMSFKLDAESNPGRFNIFDMGGFKVILDYGHNPAGYKAVIQSIRKIDADRYIGVVGMPGDRLDKSIKEVGELCSMVFNKIYLKEDRCLRGRCPGEVAGILLDAITKNGFNKTYVEIIRSETEALEKAILSAYPGDLIVMFYEEFEPAIDLIQKLKQEMIKPSNYKESDKREGYVAFL